MGIICNHTFLKMRDPTGQAINHPLVNSNIKEIRISKKINTIPQ